MRMIKESCIFLTGLILSVCLLFSVGKLQAATTVSSGTCGESVFWTLDSEGTLRITGSGAMTDYDLNNLPPWNDYSSSLKKAIIEEGVTVIGSSSFWYCESLISVTIPSTVERIHRNAFYSCSSLTKIDLPSGLTYFGDHVFTQCTKLTSLSIPEGMTRTSSNLCSNCTSLSSVDLPSTMELIDSYLFMNCVSLEHINFPEGLKDIGNSAFFGCSSLKGDLVLPEVKSIGSKAFYGCSSLTSIKLSSSSFYYLNNYAFGGCTSLKNVTLPSTLSIIYEGAFSGCESLQEISIPSNVKRIEESAFYSCSSIKQIVIPERTTIVSDNTFNGCTLLSRVELPSTLTEIGKNAFFNCTSLASISIPENVLTIKEKAFLQSGLTEVKFAENSKLTTIGLNAFEATPLLHVEIPNSVTTVEYHAFERCTSLQSASLSSKMREIKSDVFWGCKSLTSVFIPNGITKIGIRAFDLCTKLKTITFPSSVTELDLKSLPQPASLDATVGIRNIVLEAGSGTLKSFSTSNKDYFLKIYYPKDQIWTHPDKDYQIWIPYTQIFKVDYIDSTDDSVFFFEPASDLESYTIISNGPIKARCEFVGWSKTKNATTAQFALGEKITVTEDTVLYPVWKKITPPAEVKNLKAAPAGKERVTLTWTASPGAEGYLIYGKKNGNYGYVGMTTQGTTYTDTKALYNDYNFYWVFPYVKDELGTMIPGSCTKYVYAKGILTAVTGLKASSVTGGVKLTWNAVTGADGYLVYGIVDGKPYGYVGMTTKGTTFTDKTASKTQYNYYWVFPYFKDGSGKMIVGQTAKYTYGRAL